MFIRIRNQQVGIGNVQEKFSCGEGRKLDIQGEVLRPMVGTGRIESSSKSDARWEVPKEDWTAPLWVGNRVHF